MVALLLIHLYQTLSTRVPLAVCFLRILATPLLPLTLARPYYPLNSIANQDSNHFLKVLERVHKTAVVEPALVLLGCNTRIARIANIDLATSIVYRVEMKRDEDNGECSIHMVSVFFAAGVDDVVIHKWTLSDDSILP